MFYGCNDDAGTVEAGKAIEATIGLEQTCCFDVSFVVFCFAGMLILRSWNTSLPNASTLHRHTGKSAEVDNLFLYLTHSCPNGGCSVIYLFLVVRNSLLITSLKLCMF